MGIQYRCKMTAMNTTPLAIAASVSLILLGAAEQSPPHECDRPCTPHAENDHNPTPRPPVTMAPVSTANGSSGNHVVSPGPGNISIQGYPPLVEQTTFDHPESPLTLRLA